jgi:predicted DCC family thiol-disulfide oxidoreductase YuxK
MVVSNPPVKALMIYDGDCGFCRRWMNRWRRLTGDKIDYEPYQKAASRFPEITREQFGHAVHFVETKGQVTSGARAVFRSVAGLWYLAWLDGAYEHLPGFAPLSERIYRWVADHR